MTTQAPALSPTFPIGAWVRRERNGTVLTRDHFIETVINDHPTSRCGRPFRPIAGTSLRYEVAPERACKRCGP